MDKPRTIKAGDTRAETKTVTILGATGSIGRNTIDLIERDPGRFVVEALTGNLNVRLLADQARRLGAKMAVVADEAGYAELKEILSGTGIEVAAGDDAVVEAARRPADWVMAGIVGIAGLAATLAAARRGVTVALANKECLVCSGDILLAEVKNSGATLLPVDSEHNAIFQVFDFDHPEKVERIILTASGGPFREMSSAEMAGVTPEQAIDHPNWDMGAKISVDSATMMNKGLELIEAYYLFPVDEPNIEILIHPQSVVHSLVGYVDGSVLAQMGTPDMRTPISYALGWPERLAAPVARLELDKIATLTFEAPDVTRFPALTISRQALKTGGGAPTILNAANEVAVQHFLSGEIGFLDIVGIVEETLGRVPQAEMMTIDDVRAVDRHARDVARTLVGDRSGK